MNFDELEEHIKNSREFIITEKMPKSEAAFNYLPSGKKIQLEILCLKII